MALLESNFGAIGRDKDEFGFSDRTDFSEIAERMQETTN
jgi:hypothetical protein